MAQNDFIERRASFGEGDCARSGAAPWEEAESEVYRPNRGPALAVGTLFLAIGAFGFFTIGNVVPPRMPVWIAELGAAIFGSLGGIVLVHGVGGILRPARVRHASADVLPNVPTEPEIREGSVVHGRLTHELVEDGEGWQLRPSGQLWRNDKRFMVGFGVPFLAMFAGILSWVFHRQGIDWPLAVLFAATIATVSFGTVVLAIGMMMRASYRRLCWLSIPRCGELSLDSPHQPENADLSTGFKWIFLGDTGRARLTIPRQLVAAVQLCPWKYACGAPGGESITWAVQGLLVLSPNEEGKIYRLPLILTSDYIAAARLMQELAATLKLPYLFCADTEGWGAEEARAKDRRPLRTGGVQS